MNTIVSPQNPAHPHKNLPGFSEAALARVAELLYAEVPAPAQTASVCPPKKPPEPKPKPPQTPPTPPTPAPAPAPQTQVQQQQKMKKAKCTPQPTTPATPALSPTHGPQ